MSLENVISDAAARAASGSVVHIGFLDADEQKKAIEVLSTSASAVGRFYGGYKTAVRRKLVVMPATFIDETFSAGLSYVQLHRIAGIDADSSPGEAWAALRALGFLPEHLGDVFCEEGQWQAVVDSAALRAIKDDGHLVELDPAEVSFPGQSMKTMKVTVPSLRLDAVAGAGFPASRTRLAQEIRIGRFKVNGTQVQSPSYKISQGDVVTCRGRGRLTVDEVSGLTKRGRISLTLTRYNAPTTFSREEGQDAHTT